MNSSPRTVRDDLWAESARRTVLSSHLRSLRDASRGRSKPLSPVFGAGAANPSSGHTRDGSNSSRVGGPTFGDSGETGRFSSFSQNRENSQFLRDRCASTDRPSLYESFALLVRKNGSEADQADTPEDNNKAPKDPRAVLRKFLTRRGADHLLEDDALATIDDLLLRLLFSPAELPIDAAAASQLLIDAESATKLTHSSWSAIKTQNSADKPQRPEKRRNVIRIVYPLWHTAYSRRSPHGVPLSEGKRSRWLLRGVSFHVPSASDSGAVGKISHFLESLRPSSAQLTRSALTSPHLSRCSGEPAPAAPSPTSSPATSSATASPLLRRLRRVSRLELDADLALLPAAEKVLEAAPQSPIYRSFMIEASVSPLYVPAEPVEQSAEPTAVTPPPLTLLDPLPSSASHQWARRAKGVLRRTMTSAAAIGLARYSKAGDEKEKEKEENPSPAPMLSASRTASETNIGIGLARGLFRGIFPGIAVK